MSELDGVGYTVDAQKVTVWFSQKVSDGNYGGTEAGASVSQSIHDGASQGEIENLVAVLADPLKAAVAAALPEAAAPSPRKTSNSGGGRPASRRPSGNDVPVKEWVGGRDGQYDFVDGPAWVQVAVKEQAPWAAEVIHGQKRDGSGDYFQARDGQRDGKKQYLNEPVGPLGDEATLEEPF